MIATTSLGSFVVNLGRLDRIPRGEGRNFRIGGQPIAVFHTLDSNVFATEPTCPHQGCQLTQGLVGAQKVTCPLHSFVFDLSDGRPVGNNCRAIKTHPALINEEGDILVGIEALLAAR